MLQLDVRGSLSLFPLWAFGPDLQDLQPISTLPTDGKSGAFVAHLFALTSVRQLINHGFCLSGVDIFCLSGVHPCLLATRLDPCCSAGLSWLLARHGRELQVRGASRSCLMYRTLWRMWWCWSQICLMIGSPVTAPARFRWKSCHGRPSSEWDWKTPALFRRWP